MKTLDTHTKEPAVRALFFLGQTFESRLTGLKEIKFTTHDVA